MYFNILLLNILTNTLACSSCEFYSYKIVITPRLNEIVRVYKPKTQKILFFTPAQIRDSCCRECECLLLLLAHYGCMTAINQYFLQYTNHPFGGVAQVFLEKNSPKISLNKGRYKRLPSSLFLLYMVFDFYFYSHFYVYVT